MPDHSNTTEPEIDATNNQKKAKIEYLRIKRKILSHITTVRVVILVLLAGLAVLIGLLTVKGTQALNIPIYFNTAYNFIKTPVEQLASYEGRTNVLVMGKAGGAHDGPDLTDTMMLVSFSLKDGSVKIISIPRDIWIPEIRAKINSAYYWGNQKNAGGGITFAKAITSGVVGVPIQYGAVIDFSGFKDIIDQLGGIEVNIENSFTDYLYPISGREDDLCSGDPQYLCRYETLHFVQGKQLMDGETALKFVRSRHAEGIEGTDIARGARQQKVITSIKDKLLDKKTYSNPLHDVAIFKVILASIQTDIDYPTAAILARLVYNNKDSMKSFIIPENLLITPQISSKYDMQSVFIPKSGNGKWKEINDWVATILQG